MKSRELLIELGGRIEPKLIALLVIDMQNGFVHPDSGMGRSPSGTKSQIGILPRVREAVEFAHTAGISVIWSQQEHFQDDQLRHQRRLKHHSSKQGFLPCLRGTWETEIHPELKTSIAETDHFVFKHRASVFYNTNLESKLRMLGTRFLVIAGCNTEFCVESTVRDAYARDFEILVLKDAVAGIQKKFHDNSLDVIQSYFGEVITVADWEALVEKK